MQVDICTKMFTFRRQWDLWGGAGPGLLAEGAARMAKLLLEARATTNLQNDDGETALFLASLVDGFPSNFRFYGLQADGFQLGSVVSGLRPRDY